MSRLKRDRYRKKLREILARANDGAFFRMVWATDALQSGRGLTVSRYLTFPAEAATSAMDAPLKIHEWELETLIGQLLVTPKCQFREGPNRTTNCGQFNTVATAVNLLRKLENEEAGIYLKRFDVLDELHRIAHRTFPWQHGYFNPTQFYRYAFIYGQGKCGDYFNRTYGLTVGEFSAVGFAYFVYFQQQPQAQSRLRLDGLGVTSETTSAALALMSTSISCARSEASSQRDRQRPSLPTAFQPSLLRKYPIVSWNGGGLLQCPLPELIILRVTSGVFYDLVGGSSDLRNDASDRFESYCANVISAYLPEFSVSRSKAYALEGKRYDEPDLLLEAQSQLVAAVECKATKLAFDGQFAEDPIAQATAAYNEIAKGVFQLWRYFSHLRRGVLARPTHKPLLGIVLTLDPWLVMSRKLQEKVVEAAARLANDDPQIAADDRRPVVFCTIGDLERTLAVSTKESLAAALSAAVHDDRFVGWMLPDIHRETAGPLPESKPFPLELSDVLPWCRVFQKLDATPGV